jgi:hypothetical protein
MNKQPVMRSGGTVKLRQLFPVFTTWRAVGSKGLLAPAAVTIIGFVAARTDRGVSGFVQFPHGERVDQPRGLRLFCLGFRRVHRGNIRLPRVPPMRQS